MTETSSNCLGSETQRNEDYSWNESAETDSVASLTTSEVDSASTFADNLCEISWNNLKAKVVLVPCGHAHFCDSCALTCSATSQKCGL